MATLTVYPAAGANTPIDGSCERTTINETFANIRSGAGNNAYPTNATSYFVQLGSGDSGYNDLFRSIFLFTTSDLGASADISSAVLSIYGSSKANAQGNIGANLVSSNPANTNNVVGTDYNLANFGATSYASIIYADWSTTGYNDFTLNAPGITNISKTGISKFGFMSDWDFNNNFTGNWVALSNTYLGCYYADQGSNQPKLVVTYTVTSGSSMGWPVLSTSQFWNPTAF